MKGAAESAAAIAALASRISGRMAKLLAAAGIDRAWTAP